MQEEIFTERQQCAVTAAACAGGARTASPTSAGSQPGVALAAIRWHAAGGRWTPKPVPRQRPGGWTGASRYSYRCRKMRQAYRDGSAGRPDVTNANVQPPWRRGESKTPPPLRPRRLHHSAAGAVNDPVGRPKSACRRPPPVPARPAFNGCTIDRASTVLNRRWRRRPASNGPSVPGHRRP